VAYFFKQWGGHRPKSGGRLLAGQTWDAMPTPTERWSGTVAVHPSPPRRNGHVKQACLA
jgi:hypothetical protein